MSSIDTTGIDATKPAEGEATTESVRDNFSAIKTQLGTAKTELQDLSGLTDASTARTNLGLGTVATESTVPVAKGGTGSTTAGAARTALGLVIGTDVQAYDAGLADVAGLLPTDSNVIVGDGTNWVAESGATARTSLGAASVIATPTTGNLISQTAGGDNQDAGVAAADVLTSVTTADLPAGVTIQTVQTVDATNRSTTSTSYVTSSVAVAITPRDASSTVRIKVNGVFGADSAIGGEFTLYRNAIALTPGTVSSLTAMNVSSSNFIMPVTIDYPDSPASASEVTYTLYWRATSAGTIYLGRRGADTVFDVPTVITAEEIAG